MFLKDVSKMT